jgi:hypothetical protein
MPSKPCVCQGSNENCSYCFGRGYVHAKSTGYNRNAITNRLASDEDVRAFLTKHPLLNPNPLQQPEGTDAKYRPHHSTGPHRGSRDEELDQTLALSDSVRVRPAHQQADKGGSPFLDVMKVPKTFPTSTCPTCHAKFVHYIDLVAHRQAGCRRIRCIPPEQVRKSRNKRIAKTPSKMTKCSYCGCPVKAYKAQRASWQVSEIFSGPYQNTY